jgi:hypothetical protein
MPQKRTAEWDVEQIVVVILSVLVLAAAGGFIEARLNRKRRAEVSTNRVLMAAPHPVGGEMHEMQVVTPMAKEEVETIPTGHETDTPDSNKLNVLFFEAPSVRKLYEEMDQWQKTNRKRFQSVSVQRDTDAFCCIALTNPSEVLIVDPVNSNWTSGGTARVEKGRVNVAMG